jgi:hypothetical protein
VFAGIISGASSWFDGTLWTEYLVIPSLDDTVWLNTADAYLSIDVGEAQAGSLVVGRDAKVCDGVQLDILSDQRLAIGSDLYIGELVESDGTVVSKGNVAVGGNMVVGNLGSGIFIMMGGAVNVAGKLTIGASSGGIGTFHVSALGKVSANDFAMNTGSRLELSTGASLAVAGDKLDMFRAYIASGQIVSASNSGPVYAVYDCTRSKTVLHAAPSMASSSMVIR